jgi:hypothetical protein
MTFTEELLKDEFILEFEDVAGKKNPNILVQLSHDRHPLYQSVIVISNEDTLQRIFDAVLVYNDLDDVDDEGNSVYIEDMLDSFITAYDVKDGVGFWNTPDYVRCDYSFIPKVLRDKIKEYLRNNL